MADGLAHAHAEGFLLRDLHARNVVLSPAPPAPPAPAGAPTVAAPAAAAPTARLCDFGAARDLGPGGGRLDPEYVEGTPAAMSPEQLCCRTLTVKSDVWQAQCPPPPRPRPRPPPTSQPPMHRAHRVASSVAPSN